MAKIYGIMSLVFGIISLIMQIPIPMQSPNTALLISALILSIVGIIFGGLGIAKDDSRGAGKAGLFLGIIGLLFHIWWLINILLAQILFPPVPAPPVP